MTYIDMRNPAARRRVQLLALRSRLKLQVQGMQFRVSNLKAARHFGYEGPNTAKAALAWAEAELADGE